MRAKREAPGVRGSTSTNAADERRPDADLALGFTKVAA